MQGAEEELREERKMYSRTYINKKTNYHGNVRFYMIKIDLFLLKTIKHQNSSVRVFTVSFKKNIVFCSKTCVHIY